MKANAFKSRHPIWAAFAVALILATTGGCSVNMLAIPYFMIRGEPKIEPQIALAKDKKDKKRVLVLSYADSGLQFGHDAIDDELCGMVIDALQRGDERLEVVPERKVRTWRDLNPRWSEQTLQEIGEHFDVDYVIFIEVASFSITEPKNQYLLRGLTKVLFKVHDVHEGDITFDDVYEREYPPNRAVPISDINSEDGFRRAFLKTMAKELSWYVVPHQHEFAISDY